MSTLEWAMALSETHETRKREAERTKLIVHYLRRTEFILKSSIIGILCTSLYIGASVTFALSGAIVALAVGYLLIKNVTLPKANIKHLRFFSMPSEDKFNLPEWELYRKNHDDQDNNHSTDNDNQMVIGTNLMRGAMVIAVGYAVYATILYSFSIPLLILNALLATALFLSPDKPKISFIEPIEEHPLLLLREVQ